MRIFINLIAVTVISMISVISCGDSENLLSFSSEKAEDVPEWVKTVKKERSKISPFNESLLQKVTEQYNLDLNHRDWAKRCLEYREVFEQAHELTLYPTAFIAGIAMHESGGCNASASDWAGGRGLMQITSTPSKKYRRAVAGLTGIEVNNLDWHQDPLTNVMMGIIFLDDYERRLGSRPHGLLAYNMGVGGVRKTARKAGWRSGPMPEMIQLKPHLRYNRKMKPRIYVQRILASVVMMDRVMHGQTIEKLERKLEPADVPGWYPDEDNL